MADQNGSTFNIAINTTAGMGGVQAVNSGLQQTVVVTQQAAQAGQQLAGAHQAAGAAATTHAHSNSTLRLATRGANDAAWALTDLMQGNFLTAFHRAKFAVEDLGIAMRTAIMPTAIIVGLTMGIELLSHYVMSTDQAKDATKEHGKEAEATAKKVFDLNQVLRDQARETEGLIDPTVNYQHALSELDKVAARVTDSSAVTKETFEEVKKATEELDKAVDERTKRLDKEVDNTKKLIDAKKELAKAEIELRKARGEIFPDDAKAQSGEADKRAELAKLDADARGRSTGEAIQQLAAMETRNRANNAAQSAASAREALKATGFEEVLKEAAKAGITLDKLTSGKDLEALGEKIMSTAMGPGGTTEGIFSAQADQAILRNASKLFDEAQTKTHAADAEEGAAQRQEAKLAELRRQNAPLNETAATDRERINKQIEALHAEQQTKERREGVERGVKQVEEYLKANPQSADEAHAAAQDLLLRRGNRTADEEARNTLYLNRRTEQARLDQARAFLDRTGAPNAAEAAGRTQADAQRAAEAAFGGLPANQRIAAEGMDAISGLSRSGNTESGSMAQQVAALTQQLMKGQGAPEQLLQVLEQLMSVLHANHQDNARLAARIEQMKREIEILQGQQKNGRK